MDFTQRITATLQAIAEQAEDQLDMLEDVEEQAGMVTLILDSGQQYLLNQHNPTQQLWLSSPKTGGWHFVWNEAQGQWLDTKKQHPLIELLHEELQLRLSCEDFS